MINFNKQFRLNNFLLYKCPVANVDSVVNIDYHIGSYPKFADFLNTQRGAAKYSSPWGNGKISPFLFKFFGDFRSPETIKPRLIQ